MGCLPESGGCERQRTDPFVDHLNWLEGTNYVHKACLDVIDRNNPQPEALYVDEDSGASLVIERKNLVWPPEYAVGHKNDHFLVDMVTEGLRDLVSRPSRLVTRPSTLKSPAQAEVHRFREIRGGMTVGWPTLGVLARRQAGADL